ncbi:MAG: T9SS type A sorting domain-containing protein [Flavisolibacter sp.]
MRKILFSIALVFVISWNVHAQSIGPSVINSSGGSYNQPSSNFNLDWSIGEMALVSTFQSIGSNVYYLTNGFLQPTKLGHISEARIIPPPAIVTRAEIHIFPNPAISYVDVTMLMPDTGRVRLSLFNVLGREVYAKEAVIEGGSHVIHIPMVGLAQGSYFLNVEWQAHGLLKKDAYTIIKLQ